MASIKLNLSGHDNAALSAEGFTFPGALHVNLADEDLEKKVAKFIVGLGIGSGDYVIAAAPGLAPLALIVQAVIHGLTGQFFAVQLLVRQEDGSFTPGRVVDLQGLRNDTARGNHRQDVVVL